MHETHQDHKKKNKNTYYDYSCYYSIYVHRSACIVHIHTILLLLLLLCTTTTTTTTTILLSCTGAVVVLVCSRLL